MVKNPPTNSEDSGLTPGSGISPSEGNSNLLIVFLPGKSQGQRSLEGYSPWGCKGSDTTEHNPVHSICLYLSIWSYLFSVSTMFWKPIHVLWLSKWWFHNYFITLFIDSLHNVPLPNAPQCQSSHQHPYHLHFPTTTNNVAVNMELCLCLCPCLCLYLYLSPWAELLSHRVCCCC